MRVALTGSKGDISIFFTSFFSLLFLILSAISIIWSLWAERRSRTKAAKIQAEAQAG
jgi:TctA family transporter